MTHSSPTSFLPTLFGIIKSRISHQRNRLKRLLSKHRCISLKTEGPARGNVLLSYIDLPFTLKPGQPLPNTHSEFAESLEMAETFLERGYNVDVISFQNDTFVPKKDYAFFIDTRRNFQRLAPVINKNCVKIMHINAAHVLFHDAATVRRLLEVQELKGVTLRLRRFEVPYFAIEQAHYATILGNEFTMGTYKFAHKPLYRVPITSPVVYDWPEEKNFDACRKRFIWFGSGGLAHKGLHLVLEAFAQMPELELIVCGPIKDEEDFEKAYYKELYETPNIRTVGWMDISSPEFVALTNECLGLLFPSCSEGQCGSVVTAMNASLIPILSYECGVDVGDYGLILRENTIEEIKNSARLIAGLPASKLEHMARESWKYARENHTREAFGRKYRTAIDEIFATVGLSHATEKVALVQRPAGVATVAT